MVVEDREIKYMASMQIPFDIPVRQAFEAEDYLVTSSNEAAVHWLDLWPNWSQSHCVILYGTAGCGKTHLSHVWQGRSGAERLNIDDIDLSNLAALKNSLIIEDVDGSVARAEIQEKLFHLYNWQKENGAYLLLTAQQHPKNWSMTLLDLSSRMSASMAIEIGSPDDDLLAAIMVKQFLDRQINISQEVVHYLLPRIERSFEAVRHMVAQIDTLSLTQKRKITIPLIRSLLD